MGTAILISLAGALLINGVLFLIAFKLQSDKLTDISYALSFLALDVIALLYAGHLAAFNWLLFLLVGLWAVRIGGFLLYRVLIVGKDRRFDGMRESFTRFGKFWLAQAVTAWVLMLPVTIAQYRGGRLGVAAYIGLILWAVGLIIEALADYQKFAFKRNASNKGEWIKQGVWRYSRHPNYFGEILVWTSIYVYTFTVLQGMEKVLGLASPLLITLVLLFVSGVPLLEKSADARWGKLKAYQEYKQRTRLLVPLPKLRHSVHSS
ncbi:MAG TPA: DUF1295 domain-containing protein [Verrucomicrobiae bacterium]|nr:DUF1295 domain-containing protein [Verrucomicrobiae bacterium]